MLKTKTAVILIVACSVIFGLLGAAGGMEFVSQQWDAAESRRQAQDVETFKQNEQREGSISQLQASLKAFTAANNACQENFTSSTLLYETAPQLNLSITGLRGLPLIPIGVQGNSAPRWWIPAKIKPQTYGDPRGAVYFYVRTDPNAADGRLLTEGPYAPAQVNQQ